MNWIGILLLVIFIISCGGLILIVLLQAGKGASLGAAFGGGASQTVFGARSATLIGRLTWVLAGAFMATSLLLTMVSPWGDGSMDAGSTILQEEPIAAPPLGEPAQAVTPAEIPVPEPVSGSEGEMQPVDMPVESFQPTESRVEPGPDAQPALPDE